MKKKMRPNYHCVMEAICIEKGLQLSKYGKFQKKFKNLKIKIETDSACIACI